MQPSAATAAPPKRAAEDTAQRAQRLATTVDRVSDERPDFGGMTVNERLHMGGLLEQFDSAIDSGDRQRAIDLLVKVAMTEGSAADTVDTVLGNPTKYGYPRST